jgi:DNA-binding transcriptional regulator YhcF (GntR family)
MDERFVKVMVHWLWDGTAKKMGANAFLVLTLVRSYCGGTGTTVVPSMRQIQKTLGLDRRTIKKAFETLKELGFIKDVETKGPNGWKQTEYYLAEFLLARSQNKAFHGDAILEVPFGTNERRKLKPQLQLFEQTGALPKNTPIKVVNNITINMPIQTGENAVANFQTIVEGVETDSTQIKSKELRAMYERAKKAAVEAGVKAEHLLREELETVLSNLKQDGYEVQHLLPKVSPETEETEE